jgi:hypothetical protein
MGRRRTASSESEDSYGPADITEDFEETLYDVLSLSSLVTEGWEEAS